MASKQRKPARKTSLTEKQRRFVAAYVETLDGRAAARSAGYSERHAQAVGTRLLGQRRIVEAIARHGRGDGGDGESGGAAITKGWITGELTQLYQTVKACLPTPGGEEGKAPSGASLQSATKMLELLIKHLEDQSLRVKEDRADSAPDLSRLDRDELRQLEAILARTLPEAGST